MLTLAVVAPVAPAAGYGVVAFGALVAFVVCWGLLHAWKATFGAFLQWLAAIALDFDHWVVHIHWAPFRFAHTVSVDVERWLSQGMSLSEHAMVHAFNAALSIVTDLGEAVFHLGENTYTALRRLAHGLHHELPAQIRDQIVRPLVRRLERTLGQVRAQAHLLAHRLDVARAQVAHLAHALPHEIALVGQRVGVTSRQLRREARRLSRLEKATVGLGAVALVAAALGRLGLGWLRCPSLLRMGKRMGCAGFGWLEAFFATAFEALVVLDLCRFALAAQRLARLLVPQLAGVLLVQNAVCLGGGAQFPSAADRPRVRTVITLPTAHD